MGDSFAVGLGAVAGAWVDHRSGQTRMPPRERQHEEVFVLGDSFAVGLRAVAGACVGRGSGQTRMPPQERRHEEVFGLGDSFAVGLGAVAGTCVDHRSGQTRMPPQERRHEEVFVWGILLRLDWEPLRGHGLAAGAASHACRLRRDGTRRFLFGGFFCGWIESRCGGMCWPREWSDTHAAAGAAARGVLVFGLGDCFTRSELGNDTELFHPRRRTVSCEAALRILSNGEACPPCGGDSGYFPSACAK